MSQTERLYWIDAQIRARRYPNAEKVRDHFRVSLRTAYVDRNYLVTRLNAPLDYDEERGGWYYTEDTFMLPFLALSAREAASSRRIFRVGRRRRVSAVRANGWVVVAVKSSQQEQGNALLHQVCGDAKIAQLWTY